MLGYNHHSVHVADQTVWEDMCVNYIHSKKIYAWEYKPYQFGIPEVLSHMTALTQTSVYRSCQYHSWAAAMATRIDICRRCIWNWWSNCLFMCLCTISVKTYPHNLPPFCWARFTNLWHSGRKLLICILMIRCVCWSIIVFAVTSTIHHAWFCK